jgi:hypothetical protein
VSRSLTWRSALAVATIGVVLAACTSGPSDSVATVGDVEIARAQLEDWVLAGEQGNPDVDVAVLSADLLARAIKRHVVDGMLVGLGLVVDPELVAETRSWFENTFVDLTGTLLEVGYSEDFFTEVVLWSAAGRRTLVLALGEEATEEAIERAVRSARVTVDPNIGVWDAVDGFIRTS